MTVDCPASEPPARGDETRAADSPREPVSVRVVAGQGWQGKYHVLRGLAEWGAGWFQARPVEEGPEVMLRVYPRTGEAARRAQVFETLRGIECAGLHRPIEARVTEEERVEIWSTLPSCSLRQWRSAQSEVDQGLVVGLVRQVSVVLERLHQAGLAHFGLHPDQVFLQIKEGGETQFVVGGLDGVDAWQSRGLITIKVDPLLAPPETAGLLKHMSGAALQAWDWWALGRVVQQFMLGRSVVAMVPDELKAGLPKGLVGLAEALLLERATGGLRAGAVELMGALDPRIGRLLRGLLTSSIEGRWGAEDVREWLAGGMPVEHYSSGRTRKFFKLKGRPYSIAEAANRLLGPEYADEVGNHAMGFDQPGTLANFLAGSDEHRAEKEALQGVTALETSTGLAHMEPQLRRVVVGTLGLLTLAQGLFRWRGWIVNPENLRAELAKPERTAELRGELVALAEPAVVVQVRRHDQTAAALLETLVKAVSEAESFFFKQLSLTPAALGNESRLWLLALEGAAALEARRVEMKARFGLSTKPVVEKLCHATQPTPLTALVLARMADEPPLFGFLTHEELRLRRLSVLKERGGGLVKLIFWRRLAGAMAAGPILFGRGWLVAAGSTGVIFLLAVHLPGPKGVMLGLAPLLVAVGLRGLVNRVQADAVARWVPTAKPWGWRDATGRCVREANALGGAMGLPPTLHTVLTELKEICGEVKQLEKAGEKFAFEIPPRPTGTWVVTVLGWLLALLLLVGSAGYGYRRPPVWSAHFAAWREALSRPQESASEQLKNSKLKWPYRLSLVEPPFEMKIHGQFTPNGEQLKYVLGRAHQQLAPYNPETIDALTAIYVPIDDQAGALMFFDGNKNAMRGNKGVLITYLPLAKSWIQVGDVRALFIEK